MESKANNKRNQPNSSAASHFTESNAGHISVKTTSPFLNKIKDSEYSVSDQNHNKSKKNHSVIVLNKKLPRDIASGTSKMLINQILGDNNIVRDTVVNSNKSHTEKNLSQIGKSNYEQHYFINNVEYRYSTPTLNSESFSMQQGSCSREDSTVLSQTSTNQNKFCFEIRNSMHSEKQYAEKTTYCRPNKNRTLEYINKTVEKNNRLQKLVKKLIDVRKKEKHTEAWNNYINELKNKHGYGDNGRNGFMGQYSLEESLSLEYIDDYYNTQTKSKLSNPCKELLHEFYEAYNTVQYDNPYRNADHRYQRLPPQNYRSHLIQSNCYPMSSQGRLIMLNRDRNTSPYSSDWRQLPSRRPFHGNTIYVNREPTRNVNSSKIQMKKVQDSKCTCKPDPRPQLENTSIQTDRCCIVISEPEPSTSALDNDDKPTRDEGTQDENIKNIYSQVSENVDRLKKKIQETCNIDTTNLQHTVLQSIESKLDTLLTSLNSFIDEVKSRTYSSPRTGCYNCHSVCLKPFNRRNINVMGTCKSDTVRLIKAEDFVCGFQPKMPAPTSEREKVNRKILDRSCGTDIDRILMKDMSSDNVKEEIESMFGTKMGNCSVQISIAIPTNERSTEVTDSLSKTVIQLEDKSVSIEEITRNLSGEDRNMTIAVNTDPLGLLALLRVSTEAVKQLLSYMPNIPYNQYLAMINFPQRRQETHYVCNICGAAFVRPSQLSDHIHSHNLGLTRDCCVCRHVLDMQRHRPPGLFRCQHCGQRFTRAYCCELHQESCARRLGRNHDVTPSLMLLR